MKLIFKNGQRVKARSSEIITQDIKYVDIYEPIPTTNDLVGFNQIHNCVEYYLDAVEESDCKMDLFGFPIDVVKEMLVRQYDQTKKVDIRIFQQDNSADAEQGGFMWVDTDERVDFWYEVIENKDFDLFYTIFPKNNPTNNLINKDENETKLQRRKTVTSYGIIPRGGSICGKRSRTSITCGCISYSKVVGL